MSRWCSQTTCPCLTCCASSCSQSHLQLLCKPHLSKVTNIAEVRIIESLPTMRLLEGRRVSPLVTLLCNTQSMLHCRRMACTGIQARVVNRTEEHQEHYTEPVYSGLCKMYRVHQPRTRTATREVQETHYEADADKVKVGCSSAPMPVSHISGCWRQDAGSARPHRHDASRF